jgi:hypothetical protein
MKMKIVRNVTIGIDEEEGEIVFTLADGKFDWPLWIRRSLVADAKRARVETEIERALESGATEIRI